MEEQSRWKYPVDPGKKLKKAYRMRPKRKAGSSVKKKQSEEARAAR